MITLSLSFFLVHCGGGEHKPVEETQSPRTGQPQTTPTPQTGDAPQSPPGDGAPAFTGPTFEDVRPVFEAKCQTCHMKGSGLPVWTNYAEAFTKSSRIHDRAIVRKDMPPTGAPQLTADEIRTIDDWIKSGAVEAAPVIAEQPSQTDEASGEIGDGAANEAGEMQTARAAPSPRVAPPIELEGTRIECRASVKSERLGTSKNRFFSAILGEDLMGSRVYSASVGLDSNGRFQTAENIGYLRSVGIGTMELCHQVVLDSNRCSILKEIKNIAEGEFFITCPYVNNTISLSIKVLDGRGEVQCVNNDLITQTEFSHCRITQ